jgi:uncharacterized protein (TIGR03435 family)
VVSFAGVAVAQSAPDDAAKFVVTSIRPAKAETTRSAFRYTPDGGLQAANVTLKLLVQAAYDLRPEQIAGGPKWADSDAFDVEAKGPGGTAEAMIHQRLRALLAERFHLVVREDSKEMPGYDLVVAAHGPKIVESTDPPLMRQTGVGRITVRGTLMENLARFLSVQMGRSVVDRTGLTARYAFDLQWAPDTDRLPYGAPVIQGPSIFTAVQEQLGLKLVAQKVPTDLLTILQAERPTPN